MLNGPQYKFAAGLSSVEAYREAYPNAGAESARRSASKLMTNHDVLQEITRIRAKAGSLSEDAVLAIAEKRKFLARIVRAQLSELPDDSDLWQEISINEQGSKRKLPCKLKAIMADNLLASNGADPALVITINRAWK